MFDPEGVANATAALSSEEGDEAARVFRQTVRFLEGLDLIHRTVEWSRDNQLEQLVGRLDEDRTDWPRDLNEELGQLLDRFTNGSLEEREEDKETQEDSFVDAPGSPLEVDK